MILNWYSSIENHSCLIGRADLNVVENDCKFHEQLNACYIRLERGSFERDHSQTLKAVLFRFCSSDSPKSVLKPCSSRYARKRASSPSRSLSRFGIKNQAMRPPVEANAAPMRKTAWMPVNSLSKEFWIGEKTCVPIAAPAFPTAAANPRII